MSSSSTAAIMLQGTASGVGKSALTAAICRIASKRGLRVLPFKPQNMANNAAVAADGGEIGRAQHLQALAAGIPSSHHMNPVLLKPQGEGRSQIILQGQRWAEQGAKDYWKNRGKLLPHVLDSFEHCCSQADLVVVEGAGSASEVNLRNGDIANMGFAEAANVPVIIVADIRRGGVIASLVGTSKVINHHDYKRVAGFIINRFAGDPDLFTSGAETIVEKTRWKNFGIIPYCHAAKFLPPEDSMVDGNRNIQGANLSNLIAEKEIIIAVPKLKFASNLDDLEPLYLDKRVRLIEVLAGEKIPKIADAVLLTGSKNTRADIEFMRYNEWDKDIFALRHLGVSIMGICGGYQMMGKYVNDKYGVDGEIGISKGLDLLEISTELGRNKYVQNCSAFHQKSESKIAGYQIRVGVINQKSGGNSSLFSVTSSDDAPYLEGCFADEYKVIGTSVHGVLSCSNFLNWWLNIVAPQKIKAQLYSPESHHKNAEVNSYDQTVENALDELADTVAGAVDFDAIMQIASARCK